MKDHSLAMSENNMDKVTKVSEVVTTAPNQSPTAAVGGNDSVSRTTEASASVGALVFIALVVVMVILKKRCKHGNKRKSRDSVLSISSGSSAKSDDGNELTGVLCKLDQSTNLNVLTFWQRIDDGMKCLLKDAIIDQKQVTLMSPIGQGQFGCVYEATLAKYTRSSNDYGPLTHEKVAVKTLKGDNLDPFTVESFLKEGMIMKDFRHVNVLTLIGVAIGDQGIPMIVLPYMARGNLKKYISSPKLSITIRELLQLGVQVAEGMQYLADHKFVHRDLAARNCMLDEKLIVKVADFGLSRDIYTKDYYSSEDKQAKLPIKWMAIESLTKSVYTTKTDIWSFGVLIWELLTRGASPYPDVANWEIRDYLLSGRRMLPPEMCPDEIYQIMLECWLVDPAQRPSFRDLADRINSVLGIGTPTTEGEPYYANLCASVGAPDENTVTVRPDVY